MAHASAAARAMTSATTTPCARPQSMSVLLSDADDFAGGSLVTWDDRRRPVAQARWRPSPLSARAPGRRQRLPYAQAGTQRARALSGQRGRLGG